MPVFQAHYWKERVDSHPRKKIQSEGVWNYCREMGYYYEAWQKRQ
jgi:hypothetical protein